MTDTVKRTKWELLRDFRQQVPPIGFDATGQVGKRSYKYVTLGTLVDLVTPVLDANNLILVQAVTQEGVGSELRTLQGDLVSESVVPINSVGLNSQELGSAITYARRYGIITLLGLVPEEDDDGAAASGKASTPTRQSASQSQQEPAPEPGWGSTEESADAHTALSNRIGQLSKEQRSICSKYREANGGWPLAKDKFDELAAIVTALEAGMVAQVDPDGGIF